MKGKDISAALLCLIISIVGCRRPDGEQAVLSPKLAVTVANVVFRHETGKNPRNYTITTSSEGGEWEVFYESKELRFGDHYWIWVDKRTGKTRMQRGH